VPLRVWLLRTPRECGLFDTLRMAPRHEETMMPPPDSDEGNIEVTGSHHGAVGGAGRTRARRSDVTQRDGPGTMTG
jgi:hypothetical protein